jgi:hypothetical protein
MSNSVKDLRENIEEEITKLDIIEEIKEKGKLDILKSHLDTFLLVIKELGVEIDIILEIYKYKLDNDLSDTIVNLIYEILSRNEVIEKMEKENINVLDMRNKLIELKNKKVNVNNLGIKSGNSDAIKAWNYFVEKGLIDLYKYIKSTEMISIKEDNEADYVIRNNRGLFLILYIQKYYFISELLLRSLTLDKNIEDSYKSKSVERIISLIRRKVLPDIYNIIININSDSEVINSELSYFDTIEKTIYNKNERISKLKEKEKDYNIAVRTLLERDNYMKDIQKGRDIAVYVLLTFVIFYILINIGSIISGNEYNMLIFNIIILISIFSYKILK